MFRTSNNFCTSYLPKIITEYLLQAAQLCTLVKLQYYSRYYFIIFKIPRRHHSSLDTTQLLVNMKL